MSKAKTTILEICWHEAGHAVAAWAQGLAIDFVMVRAPDEVSENLGGCKMPPVWVDKLNKGHASQTLVRQCIIMVHAGFEAQQMYNPNADRICRAGDWETAVDIACAAGVGPRDDGVGDDAHMLYQRDLRDEAQRLVQQYRAEIERLALALQKQKTLSGAEVEALLSSAIEGGSVTDKSKGR